MTPEIKHRIGQIRRGEVPEGYVKKRKVVIPQQWGLPQKDTQAPAVRPQSHIGEQ